MKQFDKYHWQEYCSPYKVCLCGSTRFKDTFMEVSKQLTLQGCIVLMPGVWGHSGDEVTDAQKEMLDKLHKLKIAMSDIVLVINQDGYIGQSTQSEIEFAKKWHKEIDYLEE